MKCQHSKSVRFAVVAGFLWFAIPESHAQTWLEFAHPDSPHLNFQNPNIPITVPELLQGSSDIVITRPVLVVLLEFQNVTHRAVHTTQYWEELVFAEPRPDVRPSVAQTYRQNSNGRLLLVPATAGDVYDGNQDGIIGWTPSPRDTRDPWWEEYGAEKGRAEGIIVADAQFDYYHYDNNNDGLITVDELTVLVVFAENLASNCACDQHISHLQNPCSPCIAVPGGRARVTYPAQVPVDQNTPWPKHVHQLVTGVKEVARVGVVVHELGHQIFGLGDLYPIASTACTTYQSEPDGYTCDGVWYPPDPGIYSVMGPNVATSGFVYQLDPWAKVHLGFVRPQVVSHDGVYAVHNAEAPREFSDQLTQPEALIIYDPLRADADKEYFILENRNITDLPPWDQDAGIAIWLINENAPTWPVGLNDRHVERLIRRGGHHVGDDEALWDGIEGYDFTRTSTPRNTNWTNGSPSYVEVTDISAPGAVMTCKIRMPPICVDGSNTGSQSGSQADPFDTMSEALAAIPEPPRTIRIAGGSYDETMIIDKPCTLMAWRNGNAIIGQ